MAGNTARAPALTRWMMEGLKMTKRVLAHRPLGLLALAVSTTLLIAACAGDDDSKATPEASIPAATAPAATIAAATTPQVWAGDVCGALAAWEDSVKTIATDFSNGISKDSLSQKIDDAGQATQDLVDQLEAIGAPDTDSGKKVRKDIDKLTTDMQAGVEDIKSQVETLTDSGVGGIVSGIDEIKGEVDELLKDVKHTLHEIRQLEPAHELSTAIKNDETCQSLRPEE
jgi:hypothetical protein